MLARARALLCKSWAARRALRVAMAADGAQAPTPLRDEDDRDRSLVRVHYDVAGSTMDLARELCARWGPERDWIAVTANQQQSGRGTTSRVWISPPGNVYLSFCVRKEVVEMKRLARLPLESCLAVVDGILPFLSEKVGTRKPGVCGKLPGPPPVVDGDAAPLLALKWPNDVLLGDKKVAGMLIEDARSHMVIGIGINVAHTPQVADGGRPAAKLVDAGAPDGSAQEVAESVIASLIKRFKSPQESTVADFSALVDWSVPVRERLEGGGHGPGRRAIRLNEWGHLIVEDPEAESGEKALVSTYLF
eukprot:TRINITY_DN14264_c0_g1_i1.p1 TRINITY_DN14264_c0_g1~~TRINITY_DN14264_c0_g1_i1.p1  ORF type:complete len:305 (+),score=76.02 TRINITY_DN14264_c0_g1_i1:31-945(+)